MSKPKHQVYQSFLVRCWLVTSQTADEPAAWRFELQEVAAEPDRQRFADLEAVQASVAAKLALAATVAGPQNDRK